MPWLLMPPGLCILAGTFSFPFSFIFLLLLLSQHQLSLPVFSCLGKAHTQSALSQHSSQALKRFCRYLFKRARICLSYYCHCWHIVNTVNIYNFSPIVEHLGCFLFFPYHIEHWDEYPCIKILCEFLSP